MNGTPSRNYRALLLTEDEHQWLFGELLKAPQGFPEERLRDLLAQADARAKGFNDELASRDELSPFDEQPGTLPYGPADVAAAQGRLRTILLVSGVALLLLVGVMVRLMV